MFLRYPPKRNREPRVASIHEIFSLETGYVPIIKFICEKSKRNEITQQIDKNINWLSICNIDYIPTFPLTPINYDNILKLCLSDTSVITIENLPPNLVILDMYLNNNLVSINSVFPETLHEITIAEHDNLIYIPDLPLGLSNLDCSFNYKLTNIGTIFPPHLHLFHYYSTPLTHLPYIHKQYRNQMEFIKMVPTNCKYFKETITQPGVPSLLNLCLSYTISRNLPFPHPDLDSAVRMFGKCDFCDKPTTHMINKKFTYYTRRDLKKTNPLNIVWKVYWCGCDMLKNESEITL